LTSQTGTSCGEIDHSCDGHGVRIQIGTCITRGYVKSKIVVVVDRFVANLNHITWTLTLQVFSHDRIEYGLDGVHFLNDKSFTESHGQFELCGKVAVLKKKNINFIQLNYCYTFKAY